MPDRHGTSVFCLFHSLMEPTLVPCLSAKLRVLLSRNLPRDGCLALSAWIWWHPSFLLEFGEVFFLRTGICDRIIPFQKTVSPFDDFLPPKKMTGPPPHGAVAGRERECMRASFLLWFACTCELDWEAARSLAIVVTITSTLHVYIKCQLWQIKARTFYAF
jgi:hypothetical protein